MDILVTHIYGKTNQLCGEPFIANSDAFFKVNPDLFEASVFVKQGFVWEGANSFGTYIKLEQVKDPAPMEKKRDLMFASLGNGISVADTLHSEHGDYMKVAHINNARQVTFYFELEEKYKAEVMDYAMTANPTSSTTQITPVFWRA